MKGADHFLVLLRECLPWHFWNRSGAFSSACCAFSRLKTLRAFRANAKTLFRGLAFPDVFLFHKFPRFLGREDFPWRDTNETKDSVNDRSFWIPSCSFSLNSCDVKRHNAGNFALCKWDESRQRYIEREPLLSVPHSPPPSQVMSHHGHSLAVAQANHNRPDARNLCREQYKGGYVDQTSLSDTWLL